MAGHGSARPEDKADHPNRKVAQPTQIALPGSWFERYEGQQRRGRTLQGNNPATLGNPAGPFRRP